MCAGPVGWSCPAGPTSGTTTTVLLVLHLDGHHEGGSQVDRGSRHGSRTTPANNPPTVPSSPADLCPAPHPPAPVLFPARPRHRRCRVTQGSRLSRTSSPTRTTRTIRSGAAFPHRGHTAGTRREARRVRLSCGRSLLEGQRLGSCPLTVGWRTNGLRTDPWRPAGAARRTAPARWARRAEFARHHLWVTQHADGELHAAGDYPNQHPGGDGLPAFTARQPLTRAHRRRVVVHLRIEPRRPPGGLAGDARGVRRIPPPARRLLRPQPGARRATTGPHQPKRALPVTAEGNATSRAGTINLETRPITTRRSRGPRRLVRSA